ncbi:hypothetical protein [Thalassotalea agariperforans]
MYYKGGITNFINLLFLLLPVKIIAAVPVNNPANTSAPAITNEISTVLSAPRNLEKVEVIISSPTNIASAYKRMVDNKRCDQVTHEDLNQQYRGAIEILIVCKALYTAGVEPVITIIPAPNYTRALKMAESGMSHLCAETVWLEDINQEKFYYTDAIIREGEFEKGLYAPIIHRLFSQADASEHIEEYIGTTVKNWHKDSDVLQQITNKIFYSYRYSSIYQLLKAGRVDFTLLAFPSSDNLEIIARNGIKLRPIDNVKVQLPGTRHFIIAKVRPGAEKIYQLLNIGIKKLREKDEIKRLFYATGVFNEKTKSWKVINKLVDDN